MIRTSLQTWSAARTVLLGSLVALLLVGCERAGPLEPPVEDETPSFAAVQSTVFDQSCAFAGCHAGDFSARDLDLSEGVAYDNLVGAASGQQPDLLLVEPGNPEMSYLLRKIEGDPSITGSRMPMGRGPLPDEQIDLVREWIEGGAPED